MVWAQGIAKRPESFVAWDETAFAVRFYGKGREY